MFALAASLALSWGPWTHQSFAASDEARAGSSQFIAGSSAPDAFKTLEPSLHSLDFAAALYNYAAAQHSNDTIDFALGFGCHLVEDMVGHHVQGFLNPEEDHPLEIAVDAFVYHSYAAKVKGMSFEQISKETCAAVVQASALASGSIKAITQKDASSAVLKFRTLTSSEEAAIALDPAYKADIVKDSYCNVTDFAAAKINFDLASNWSTSACSRWQQLMLSSHGNASAPASILNVTNLVDSLFLANGGSGCSKDTR